MNYLAEQREREKRIKERELNRLKERKPHLFNGTPQKHVFDKYCIHLFDNNVFAKVKTDQYGNVQRGSGMENVRIIDLKVDNIVQFQATFKGVTAMQTAIVNRVYAKEILLKTVWYAEVENAGGYKFTLTDNDDFIRVNEPFTRKVDMKEGQDMVNKPKHYTYGDIEVIDFIEQVTKDYKPELAFSIGNAIKYISRANHKNGREDLDKARWYLNRAFAKWED